MKTLTARQIDVLKLIAVGYPLKAIAPQLGISKKTVEKHSQDIKNKLGVHSISFLIHYALHHGLVKNIFDTHSAESARLATEPVIQIAQL